MTIHRAHLLLAAALLIGPRWLGAQANDTQQQAEAAKQEGVRLAQSRNWAAAVEAYDRAIQLKPDFKDAYKGRGAAHRRLQKPELATEDYGRSIHLDPEDAEAYLERGHAYVALRQFDVAIQDFDKAIQIKPDDGSAYLARGGAKSQSGDRAGSQTDWAKAESLGCHGARLIHQVRPVYPQKAKKARISGVVTLAAVIGKRGTIQELRLVTGHPWLVPAAMDAVKQWVYTPTLINGQPVEVETRIDVTFTLSR